ncbi:MAG: HAD family hydrolase [Bacilli bacterium]|nr:HAD family hydrolase [Bacilli bacterium]
MFENFIFDLDGTILDTIEGIMNAVNEALEACGYPQRFDREGTKPLIGNGAKVCIQRALLDKGNDPVAFAEMEAYYMPAYARAQLTGTHPFPEVAKTLQILKNNGKNLFVATNKPDNLANIIVPKYYPENTFSYIVGVRPGGAVKPDPTNVLDIIKTYRLDPAKTLYVGDSHVDIETGHNAGLAVCLVKWGYDFYTADLCRKAEYAIDDPAELLNL